MVALGRTKLKSSQITILWLGGLVKYGLDSDPPGKRISLRRSLIGALEDLKRSCDQRNSKVQPSERLVHRRFHVPGRGTVTLDRDKRVRRPLRRLHRHLRSCYGDGELCSQQNSFLQPELSKSLRCPSRLILAILLPSATCC